MFPQFNWTEIFVFTNLNVIMNKTLACMFSVFSVNASAPCPSAEADIFYFPSFKNPDGILQEMDFF